MSTNNKRIYLSPPHMGGNEQEYVRQAFESNFIAPLGPMVNGFEQDFSELTGFKHCAALSSGTAALHLALRIVGVEPGDVVIASSLTFIGSVSPVTFLGAEPVFIDSDYETWNMDPELLAEAVDHYISKGRKPKAVIPTDLYGQCADYDRILEILEPHEIPLIVDAAESVGALYKGRHAGKGALMASYSFNGNKIITSSGGGLLASDNDEMISRARWLSQQAKEPEPYYEHKEIGYNYRMSNVVAAVGRGQVEVIPDRVKRKREIFDYYEQELGHCPGISFMPEADYGECNRWLSVILVDKDEFGASPDEIRIALEEENIESRPVWKPMHNQPVFKNNTVFGGKVSEDLFARGLCLPSGTAMTTEDMERIVDLIKRCGK
ncbi:DegT/DnrJ/EryC1/StrS family aminotransferase [Maridesulfovibrio salexigens]|uniref:DegT/DnrJ/EryC1/StrS aminotransferase n=1 Tax=Maridesulfovibrio salexigens (strain ATCC 14822 / DSM 2638 / NCIMB 8403 / VKM B-1763) TaxID=526222 RepID=C6BTI4_MARSD|nr:DegT/DnrJ/EryC1/StrS family aminotransferase [Maridesulfovibrio salexigens]ACS81665.1 DegT/DnrJ/EryC1/StrS aminotransferase [Maridesulfovibrio salexigens DSM 2638]